uniref:Uncharacterized protein n=1 Tax=Arundo donax TaxID=35708 RepID=A0A0A8ZZ70_ARUDO
MVSCGSARGLEARAE